ncbi:PREDICTED: Fanconi anemia group J protein [Tarenaya hassleriana]|uniref:Fanconi anemia group J protein n=1 Tax=Tarenaya hassleriana TaxID=28532 RepID=UPI00053C4D2A|nr:PREDICTED: Fanconi anemia group J protein [Tarenaya hassleriana]
MVFTTAVSEPKHDLKRSLSSRNPKNVYPIGGIQVEFPYQPYGTQLAFMSRVIATLDRAQREGHCHALLESPTGTGKSLSLLCSVLAWHQNYKLRLQLGIASQSKPAPEALADPLNHGGGFIPETQPSSTLPGNQEQVQASANKKTKIPTIYYASRTHSQISQVIREYRKTAYRVPMAVLASRKHYCTNRHVQGKENVDDECRLLLKDKQNIQCPEFKNVHKVTGHPSLQKGGYNEVHDIEDLVKIGKNVKGCPYYAAWSMSGDAQLVFCPYSYIINPVVRAGVEVDLKGAIIIFDEAHNMEDIARDAGSSNIEEDTLFKLQSELEQMSLVQPMTYQPLYEIVEGLISWIGRNKDFLAKRDFQHYFSSWTGNNALRELQGCNITQECFPILLECATKAIRASKEAETEPNVPHLSGISVLTLEALFASLTYFFSRNGSHILDYQLGLQRYMKRGDPLKTWTHTFSLWCMNPSVVFKDLADLSMSIILTSGTLSPMDSFSSELGMQFGSCLEAPHVIDIDSQVWASAIFNGPDNYPLNASYKTAGAYSFQDALGKALEEICTIVPGGSLVFFPSYKLMEKLCSRWQETGQWSRLSLKKTLFIEPRGGAQEKFEPVLKGYYDAIRGKNKPSIGRKKKAKKTGPDTTETQDGSKKGAAFLAVCRGKVSEGIDFADDNARAVIIVGIPFPNINDIQVGLKKKYNDTYKTSKNLLGGSDWYCHQAFRALNQAAGRCIRHRFDYGAVILLDERYREERIRSHISKWLRQSIKQYENFDTSLEGLRSFFDNVKERVNGKMVSSQDPIAEEKSPSVNQSKECRRKENQKLDKFSLCEPKDISGRKVIDVEEYTNVEPKDSSVIESKKILEQRNEKPKLTEHLRFVQASISKYGTSVSQLASLGDKPAQKFLQAKKETECCKEFIDVDHGFQEDPRYCEASSMTDCGEDPEASFVRETPSMINGTSAASPCSPLTYGSPSPTIAQTSAGSPGRFLEHHLSATSFIKSPLITESAAVVTPERYSTGNIRNMIQESESSLSMSVNSRTSKRRKPSSSPFIDLVEDENHGATNAGPPDCMSFTRRIEYGLEGTSVEQLRQRSNVLRKVEVNNNISSTVPMVDQRLQVSCSLCRSPLGCPESHLYLNCSLTSSFKTYLLSLLKETTEKTDMPTSVSVLVTDSSSVDQRVCRRTLEGAGQGIWCEQDGCVFNNIFCPFCSNPDNCLGVQVMATDSSNVQLLSKILFFSDRLEVGNSIATQEYVEKEKEPLPEKKTAADKGNVLKSIESYAYSPRQQESGGWRTTKSKLRLPKRDMPSR